MIGPRVKQIRKEKKLSQQVFASLVGTSSGYISEIEKSKKTPGADFFQSVKRAFPSINLEWVLTGIGEMESRSTDVHQVANADGAVQVGGGIKINGDAANFVIGGSHRNKTSKEMPTSYGNGLVKIEKVVRVLEDYVAPKMIEEIKERLSN